MKLVPPHAELRACFYTPRYGPLVLTDDLVAVSDQREARPEFALGELPGEIVFAWSSPREWLVDFLLVAAYATNTIALTIYTAIAVVALLVRKHQRAAIWTILVMASAAATTTARPIRNSPAPSRRCSGSRSRAV